MFETTVVRSVLIDLPFPHLPPPKVCGFLRWRSFPTQFLAPNLKPVFEECSLTRKAGRSFELKFSSRLLL
eukprot:1745966-Amphidinium_carterae.1